MYSDVSRAALAASWRVAAELARRFPAWRVLELHPADGKNDVLALVDEHGGERVCLDRAGTVHVDGSSTLEPGWSSSARSVDTVALVSEITALLGSDPRAPLPRATPRVLGYRVIAAALAASVYEAMRFDARSLLVDSVDAITAVEWRSEDPGLRVADPRDVWVVLAGSQVQAHIHDGWLFGTDGSRIDLTQERARGASLASLGALVLRRPARSARSVATHPDPVVGPPPSWVRCPPVDCGIPELDAFAWSYDAYFRITSDGERLHEIVRPLLDPLLAGKGLPTDVGPDLLRATLFLMQRRAHWDSSFADTYVRRGHELIQALGPGTWWQDDKAGL